MKRRYFLLLLVFVMALMPFAQVAAAPAAPRVISLQELERILSVEGEPLYTEADMTVLTTEILPLVEKYGGRKFKVKPEVVLADRAQMARILFEEAGEIKAAGPANPFQSMLAARALLGKFGVISRKVYMLPRNLGPIMQLYQIDPQNKNALVKLIFAHELVHALQDQETNLQRIFGAANMEEISCQMAVSEGQAVLIEEMIGKQLGLEEAFLLIARMVSTGSITTDDPLTNMTSQVQTSYYEQIYLGGKKFIEYHYQQGGMEKVWQILQRPPATSAMIAKPATYSPARPFRYDYAKLLDGLERELGPDDLWDVQNMEIGEIFIRSGYAILEPMEREEVVAQIETVQTLSGRSPASIVNVSVIMVKDRAFVPRYMEILAKTTNISYQNMAASFGSNNTGIQVKKLKVEEFKAIPSDASQKVSYDISIPEAAIRIRFTLVRIVRGRAMVELYFSNLKLSNERIGKVAEIIFSRFDELKIPY